MARPVRLDDLRGPVAGVVVAVAGGPGCSVDFRHLLVVARLPVAVMLARGCVVTGAAAGRAPSGRLRPPLPPLR